MQKDYLTTLDVSKMFKCSLSAIHLKLYRGIFPKAVYFKLGRRIYFNEEKLINWIEKEVI